MKLFSEFQLKNVPKSLKNELFLQILVLKSILPLWFVIEAQQNREDTKLDQKNKVRTDSSLKEKLANSQRTHEYLVLTPGSQ